MQISSIYIDTIYRQRAGEMIAFASLVLDDELRVNDIRVVERCDGQIIVNMPCKDRPIRCPACEQITPLRSSYCCQCGTKIDPAAKPISAGGKERRYIDLTHPITPELRGRIDAAVVTAYRERQRQFGTATVAA
jgi:DNA-binding cell septation regulator SpoVG